VAADDRPAREVYQKVPTLFVTLRDFETDVRKVGEKSRAA
jgi:hypothetical protein